MRATLVRTQFLLSAYNPLIEVWKSLLQPLYGLSPFRGCGLADSVLVSEHADLLHPCI